MSQFIYSNLKDKATFVAIRKNASSSIAHSIFKYQNEYWFLGDINTSNVYKYSKDIPKDLNEYKFTCIRDPFKKIVSGFIHKIVINPGTEGKDYFDKNPKHRSMTKNIPKYFDSFLSYIEDTGVENVNIHFQLQYDCAKFDKICYDKVLIFENLKNDWTKLQKDIAELPNLPLQKIHSTGSSEYYNKLKPLFLNRVQSLYLKDYQIYNSFNI